MRSAAFHNLGCKVNAYEAEAMQQLLEEAGYTIVPFTEKADVYIINTCSVTNMADHKSRQMIHRARALNPQAVIVAAGCYVQVAEESLKKDLSADILIGSNHKKDIVSILGKYFEDHENCAYISDIAGERDYEELSVKRPADRTRAFVKIEDGCDQFCSYCIIPYARGRVRSRSPEEVEEEVRTLAGQGYKEIVLTGIHLSSYGADFYKGSGGPRHLGDTKDKAVTYADLIEKGEAPLLSLIKRLHSIEGLERIRLSSLEPRIITPDFVDALRSMEKICPHFHLSLQSGCDATLLRMNRHYTTAEYLEKCDLLRAAYPHPAITTDVIVGFPGESDEEFSKTEAFVRKARFYEMHIFKYSRRGGTRADKMEGQITEKIKSERSASLFKAEKEMSDEFRSWYLGRECEVLLEEKITLDGTDYWTGYTKEYVRAAVKAEYGRRNSIVKGMAASFLNEETLLLEPIKIP